VADSDQRADVIVADHRVAGTYNLHQYLEQKTYVAYAIENQVREAIGMKRIPMPVRPTE
jgi:hypothetical protein